MIHNAPFDLCFLVAISGLTMSTAGFVGALVALIMCYYK